MAYLQASHIKLLGLEKIEVLILEALQSKALSLTDLSRHIEVPRTTLPRVIKKLNSRGFLKRITVGKRKKWLTVSPSEMFDIFAACTNQLDKHTTKTKLRFDNETEFTIYRGAQNIFDVFEKLSSLHKGERVYGIQPDESIQEVVKKLPVEKLLKINNQLKNNKIVFEGIVHKKSVENLMRSMGRKNAKKLFDSFVGRLEDYVNLPDDFLNVRSEIYIYRDSAAIINWYDEVAIVIKNPDMIVFLKGMFQCVKEFGQRYSQNEAMKVFLKPN